MSEIVQLVDDGLGNSSYLVELGDGRAMAVDPSRDLRSHLGAAERRRLRITHTVETHLHADFVSGSRELASLGASVVAPAAGHLEFPAVGLDDGAELDLGGLRLQALATPGHTPEHVAYLLLDGEQPLALFSGGSLLVGAVARTDLIDPEQTEPLARALWRSLHERILSLPDDLPVYPTHGAGSFCSAPAGAERSTTIGREKATNPLLAAVDEDAFVKELLGGLGSYPPYFLRLREVNRRGPRVFGVTPPVLPRLEVQPVNTLLAAGAWVVDVRPVPAFAEGHVPGSVSIPLRPQFASWLGWVVPDDVPVVFVLGPDQDRTELVQQARKIGYERLAGELADGVEAWVAAGGEVARVGIEPVAQADRTVVDVRQRSEFEIGRLPGAHHVELGTLAADTSALPTGPVAVMCGHGERAMTAASLLERTGRRDVVVLTGGPDDWAAVHGPLERGG